MFAALANSSVTLDRDFHLATRNVRDVRHSGAAVFDPWNDDPAAFPLKPQRFRRGY